MLKGELRAREENPKDRSALSQVETGLKHVYHPRYVELVAKLGELLAPQAYLTLHVDGLVSMRGFHRETNEVQAPVFSNPLMLLKERGVPPPAAGGTETCPTKPRRSGVVPTVSTLISLVVLTTFLKAIMLIPKELLAVVMKVAVPLWRIKICKKWQGSEWSGGWGKV